MNRLKSGEKLGYWLVIFGVILVVIIPYFGLPLSNNEGIYDSVALTLENGGSLFTSTWDHKPPLIFLVFLVIRFLGFDLETGIHSGAIALHCITAFCIVALVRRVFADGAIALGAGLVYGFLLMDSWLQTWTLQAELLQNIFVITAFLFALSDSKASILFSGMLGSAAFFSKPTAVLFFPVVLLIWKGKDNFPDRLKVFLMGVNLMAILVIAPFLFTGRMKEFWVAVSEYSLRVYGKLGWTSGDWREALFGQRAWIQELVFDSAGAFLVAISSWLGSVGAEKKTARVMWAWFVIAILVGFSSGFARGYYFLVILPPLSILVTMGIRSLGFRSKALMLIGIVVCMAPLCRRWFTDIHTRNGDDVLKRQSNSNWYHDARIIGKRLAIEKVPGDGLVVWARIPEVYSYAGIAPRVVRTPMISHTYNLFGELEAVQKRFMDTPPRFVVMSSPVQVGELPPPDWLVATLASNYRLHFGTQGNVNFSVFERLPTQGQ